MATKKQKHAAALASREKFMAQVKADGLAALRADQERRQREKDEAINEASRRQRGVLKARAERFSRIAESAKRDGRIVEDFTTEAPIGIDLARVPDIDVIAYLQKSHELFPIFSDTGMHDGDHGSLGRRLEWLAMDLSDGDSNG